MPGFRFLSLTPHPLLRPYLAKMSVFESGGRLPEHEKKLIVPNANLKLTLTYRNGIVAKVAGRTFSQAEHQLSLTGLIDSPVNLNPLNDAETGTIILEFNPLGTYRFFRLNYAGIKDHIVDLNTLIGTGAALLKEQLAEATAIHEKVIILQNFLITLLTKQAGDPIYDYCATRIETTNGLVSVKQLEKETGYSSRWLHRKFNERIGTGPKNLAEIIRFRQFYQAYASAGTSEFSRSRIDHNYYDQSHFLRAFRRFTGTTPTELQHSINELSIRNFIS